MNKAISFLHVILSNKVSLQQQIQYNGNIYDIIRHMQAQFNLASKSDEASYFSWK